MAFEVRGVVDVDALAVGSAGMALAVVFLSLLLLALLAFSIGLWFALFHGGLSFVALRRSVSGGVVNAADGIGSSRALHSGVHGAGAKTGRTAST